MIEGRFYRAILTGRLEEKEMSEFYCEDIIKILSSFSGILPEKRLKNDFLYGMENQSIFGYGIKIHHYQTFINENLLRNTYGNE